MSLWYNAMEFARAGAMIADDVFGFKTPYTLPIHNEMKHSQAGDAGDMVFKNRETFHKLSRRISKKQWTWVSAWVANCEFRQAEKKFGSGALWALCKKYDHHRKQLRPLIQVHVDNFEAAGANCLCTQVCKLIHEFETTSE